jgi:hypothetical protein
MRILLRQELHTRAGTSQQINQRAKYFERLQINFTSCGGTLQVLLAESLHVMVHTLYNFQIAGLQYDRTWLGFRQS